MTRNTQYRFITSWLLAAVMFASPCCGWFDTGHHLVGILAFDQLAPRQQQELRRLLNAHPRKDQEFLVPREVQTGQRTSRWLLGRASCWPDLIRGQEEWDRPTWHYQLGASLAIGTGVRVPPTPTGLPADVSLQTGSLHIAQAIEFCRSVLRDRTRSDADRALAVCWLAHLAGDSHQPCHAGSLYYHGVFPDGDRGANWLRLTDGSNLHAFWDGQFGSDLNWSALDRRAAALRSSSMWQESAQAARNLDPLQWLSESLQLAQTNVYTDEVLSVVEATRRSGQDRVAAFDLSPEYSARARVVAERRLILAAQRLANLLTADLTAQ